MNRKERRANKKKNGKAPAKQPNLVAQSLAAQIPGAQLDQTANGKTKVSLPVPENAINRTQYYDDFKRAKTLVEEDNLAEATKLLTTLLKQNPQDHGLFELFALASEKLKNYEAALKFYTQARSMQAERPAVDAAIANILIKLDRLDEGLEKMEACIAEDSPDLLPEEKATMYSVAGNTYMLRGDKERGIPYLDKAIEIAPDNIEFLYNMVSNASKPKSKDNKYFKQLIEISQTDDSTRDAYLNSLLYYALFDCYDGVKEYEKAFDCALKGAEHKKEMIGMTSDRIAGYNERITHYFTKEFFDVYEGEGDERDIPVFVLGMPRSGTTLLEQILQSHPDIGGVGEDALLGHLIRHYSLLADFRGAPYPLRTTREIDGFFTPLQVGQKYSDYLEKKLPDKKRVINKSIGNILFAGYLSICMPKAKFIHIKRNAMDSCLSTFTKNFTDKAQAYSYDLGELGLYYKTYVHIMEHWNDVLKDKIINITYEDIVDDLESNARKLIDFIDLPWDDRCLSFHETESVVRTASVTQVRKPIYKSAVGRWKRYGPKVLPLIEALGDAAPPEAVEYLNTHKK